MIAHNVSTVLGIGLLLAGPPEARAGVGPSADQVATAITKGVAYLKEMQRRMAWFKGG